MRKRFCLIACPVAFAAALLVSAGASAKTCSSDPDYCPAQRLAPTGFSARTVPARDRSFPYTFVTTGRIGVPTSVGNRVGCDGKVSVTIKAKKVTVSSRIAFVHAVGRRCVYKSTVTFAWRKRIESFGGTPFALTVIPRFLGNKYLSSVTHRRYTVIEG